MSIWDPQDVYIYILIIYIEVTRKRRDYTFIPTSLFRDFSLIRGFYCQEYKNIHNHHLYTRHGGKFKCFVQLLHSNTLFLWQHDKVSFNQAALHIKKHLKNVDISTIYIMNHQQLTK